MPRRLFTELQRKFGDTKKPQAVIAQREALAQVGRVARATHEGAQSLFQVYYGGRRVASQCPHKLAFRAREKANRPYVVVVGAGLAGLACARYELVKSQQYNVILVEAGNRVGGRVWSVQQNSFENTITGTDHEFTTVERGGELVGLNHFLWLHYADEFDLHLDYLDPPSAEESVESAEALAGLALLYDYTRLDLDEEAAKIDIFSDDAKSAKPWEAPDAKRLDGISLGAFLDEISDATLEQLKAKGFTQPEFQFDLFEKAMAATKADFENNNGLPCDEQKRYFNLVTIGNGNRNLDPALLESVFDNIDGIEQAEKARQLSFWDDAELFRCREGNMALAVKFHQHILQEGGQVLLNTAVSDIVVKANHVKIIVKKGGVAEKLRIPENKVSKVVLAVPPSVWKHINISPSLPTTVEPKMGYLVKYLFDVPAEVTEQFKKCGNTTHTKWGMVWEAAKNITEDEKEKGKSGRKPIDHTLAVFAGGASAYLLSNPPDADKLGVEAARRKYIFDNLNLMRPTGMAYTFDPASVIRDVFMDWPKHEMVEVGYACPTLNEVVNLGPVIHGTINGKIVLAGEYACRYKWCGFMEGALISGAGAAKEILKGTETENVKPKNIPFQRPSQRAFDGFRGKTKGK